MAANAILADSSFYLRLLWQGHDPLGALTAAALARDVAICGVVRCEVGRALRVPKVRQRFQACWDTMINVPEAIKRMLAAE